MRKTKKEVGTAGGGPGGGGNGHPTLDRKVGWGKSPYLWKDGEIPLGERRRTRGLSKAFGKERYRTLFRREIAGVKKELGALKKAFASGRTEKKRKKTSKSKRKVTQSN